MKKIKTKTEATWSIDIEVIKLIKEKTTPFTNKSAFVNNLLRKSLGLSYIKDNNN